MSSDKETKVSAVMIIEVIGRPPEHLTETLEGIVKQIGEEKGVEVTNKKINEPVLMKDQEDFYMSFVEVEVEVDEILYLSMLVFKYMPAHIEIIHPEKIVLTNNGMNEVLNEITRRLHGYDELAKILQMENAKMQRKVKELEGK
ncbi:MAG: hypothetical protein ABIA78_02850 [archaeon]